MASSEGKAEAFMRNPQEDPRWAENSTDACWKEVKQNATSGRWSHCRFTAGHEGDCVDIDGWLRDNH